MISKIRVVDRTEQEYEIIKTENIYCQKRMITYGIRGMGRGEVTLKFALKQSFPIKIEYTRIRRVRNDK